MFKKIFTISAVLIIITALTACFNPSQGNETTLTINLGGGNSRSATSMPWPPSEYPGMLDEIEYKVMISGNEDIISLEAKGGDTIRVAVSEGIWNVTIDAYYQNKHYATGSNSVDVKAGQDNTVTVSLSRIHWYTVTFDSGNGEPFTSEVRTGTTIAKPDNPGRTGHFFVGWYADLALDTPYDFDTPVTADFTLYAKWNIISEFHINSVTYGLSEDVESVMGRNNDFVYVDLFLQEGVKITINFYVPGNDRLVEGIYNPSEYDQNSGIYYPPDETTEWFNITGGTVKVSVSGEDYDAIYTIDIDCVLEAEEIIDGEITGNVITGNVKGIYQGTLVWKDN